MKQNTDNDKANLAETIEDEIEETVLVTTKCTDKYECSFNDKVKKALMIEDAALGCWISCDEGPNDDENSSDNGEEQPSEDVFDANKNSHNEENVEEDIVRDLQNIVPHDVIRDDFWMIVGTEIDRILSSNNILMVSESEHQNNQVGDVEE